MGDPTSVAVSPDGKSVYVAGAGPGTVVRFARDTTTGALTPKGCVGDAGDNPANCSQTAKGLDGADSVAVSSDGKSVYVASLGDNAIVRFNRDTTTGKLTAKGCIAQSGSGTNPAGCSKTANGLRQATSVTVSSNGKSVYATAQLSNSVVHFERDTTTGALTAKGCVGDTAHNSYGCSKTAKGLYRALDVIVSRGGTSVYVTSSYDVDQGSGDNAVVRFNRDKTTGALTPKGCISGPVYNPAGCSKTATGLNGARKLAISPGGTSVYVTSYDSHSHESALVRFDRDTTTGVLTPDGCVGKSGQGGNPGCNQTADGLLGAYGVAVSSDGKSVYVASLLNAGLVNFKRSTTGALTFVKCYEDPDFQAGTCPDKVDGLGLFGFGADSVAVSPDGTSVYALGAGTNAIVRFDREL
jgi:fibronectin-binding autotransporter adhesin